MTRTNLRRIGKILFGVVCFALSGCQAPMRTEAASAGAGTPSPGSISGSAPRFSADGPDADEYGARLGYPVAAINRPRFFVGTFSHQDQVLEGWLIRRADTPSRLARASVVGRVKTYGLVERGLERVRQVDLRHRGLGTCPARRQPDLGASGRDFSDTDRIRKTKGLAGIHRLTPVILGSPTWARTRDLRINSCELADLARLHG